MKKRNKKIALFLALSLALPFAHAEDNLAAAKTTQVTADVFKDVKTVGEALKRIEKKLDPNVVLILKNHVKGHERDKVEIRKISKAKLVVDASKQSNTIEFLGPVEGSETRTAFLVNGKDFELDSEVSVDDNLNELAKVLPKQRLASLVSLIFPSACADDGSSCDSGGGIGSLLMPAAIMCMALMFMNRQNSTPSYPPPMPMVYAPQPQVMPIVTGGYGYSGAYGYPYSAAPPTVLPPAILSPGLRSPATSISR